MEVKVDMPGWFDDNTPWPCGRFWCIFGTLEVPHRLDYFAGTERYWVEGSVVYQEFQVDCMKMVTVGKFEGGARKIGRSRVTRGGKGALRLSSCFGNFSYNGCGVWYLEKIGRD